ncbi:MAG: YicC/YloC family endoribonuclease [Gemmatimonadota bacterium]|nr:YicC/YloC family endoribonuclease [Gemmatimonadota bacterium]
MIRSMTGYGDAERESDEGLVRLEVRTVNHRFFNTSVKTPPGFDRFDKPIVDGLKCHLTRGHVSATLTIERNDSGPEADVRVDFDRARALKEALEELRDDLSVPGMVDLSMIMRFGELFRGRESNRGSTLEPAWVRSLAAEAAGAAREMREDEGRRLERDLMDRVDAMEGLLDEVGARAPERLTAERDRLREAVAELTAQAEVDEDRLAREIAYLAERWDINEELVRFRSHIDLFRDALAGDGSEPVGKRLGFLVQEMHREANTIGSKANDAAIAQASVGLKEEIERIREQVENVE